MTVATVVGDLTRRCPRSRHSSGRASRSACSKSLIIVCSRGRIRSPSAVSVSRRVVREKSRMPTSSSNRSTRLARTAAATAELAPGGGEAAGAGGDEECPDINELCHDRPAACPALPGKTRGRGMPRRRSARGALCIRPARRAIRRGDRTGVPAMILYPAIDLKDGQCVRLLRGDMDARHRLRRRSRRAGAGLRRGGLRLAASGRPQRRLRRAAGERGRRSRRSSRRSTIPVQLGGGIRDRATIEAWLDKGVRAGHPRHRGAARSRRWCARPPARIPGRIAVGIDARGGRVAVEGWAGDHRHRRRRPRAALRGRRRRRDHLHRHRPRRGDGRARTSRRRRRWRGRWRSR